MAALQRIVNGSLGNTLTDVIAFETWARSSVLTPLDCSNCRFIAGSDYPAGAGCLSSARLQVELMRLLMSGDGSYKGTQIMDREFARQFHDMSAYVSVDAQPFNPFAS